jgi:hypothetical protein
MPIHKPAWTVAKVRKQGANAQLSFWLGEIVLGPAILFMNRIVRMDADRRKRTAAVRNPVAEREVVPRIREQCQQDHSGDNAEEYAFQSSLL